MIVSNEELREISIKIERDGRAFYQRLSEHISDPVEKEFLEVMAKEEIQHEIQFKKMLDDKGERAYGWEGSDALGDMIQNRFQTDIFPPLDEILGQVEELQGIEKALDFAMEAEKIAAEFYGLLREACNNIEVKTLLVLLEKAEHEHLERVQQLREKYLKQASGSS